MADTFDRSVYPDERPARSRKENQKLPTSLPAIAARRQTKTRIHLARSQLRPLPHGPQPMTTLDDASSIHILKTIAESQLRPTAPDLTATPHLRAALAATFSAAS